MKNLKTEYKILLFVGCVFFATLIVYLIQSGFFSNLFINLKKEDYITCTEQNYVNGFSYTEYRCSIRDDKGNYYSLSYPKINVESDDVEKLNNRLKENFEFLKESFSYGSNLSEMELDSYTSSEYTISSDSKIVSLLVSSKRFINTDYNLENSYMSYNISRETGKILSDDEVKAIYSIDLTFSSRLRAEVVKMYASEFGYNYYAVNASRNREIDASIENVLLSSIQNIYLSQDGNVSFFLKLYNPSYFQNVTYRIIIDKNNEIELKMVS